MLIYSPRNKTMQVYSICLATYEPKSSKVVEKFPDRTWNPTLTILIKDNKLKHEMTMLLIWKHPFNLTD